MITPRAGATLRIAVASILLASSSALVTAQARGTEARKGTAAGIWIGSAQLNEREIPFHLDISGNGDQIHGELVNGKERYPSSTGSYSNGRLLLHFDYYANTLDATIESDVLTGSFRVRGRSFPIKARLNGTIPGADANPPRIEGVWNVAVDNGAKGEHSWKLRIRQVGSDVDAVIERIDGDTGNLYGVWRNGEFEVSHFTAAGPNYAVLRPQRDGTLQLETSAHGVTVQTFTAKRAKPIKTIALEDADDPIHHTTLKNPGQPLEFRFPDLNGKVISDTDPEFAHKALILSIGGSWCPNCQDEAPFLEKLYRKYHSRGLEIVELSFEEPSQLQNPARLRAVIRRYGITYQVLIAGTPEQLNERFPQVANLNCWPTTFFIGKDRSVKAIHTGYAGPATGDDNHKLENDMTALVEQLLADKNLPARPISIQEARAH